MMLFLPRISMRSLFGLAALLLAVTLSACWSDYGYQSNRVAPKLFYILIKNGVCSSNKDCIDREIFLGSHRGSVKFYFYGVSDRHVIDEINDCIMMEKAILGDETPFYVVFYKRSHREILSGSPKEVIYRGKI